jgi:AcrR family transcriptional regulator
MASNSARKPVHKSRVKPAAELPTTTKIKSKIKPARRSIKDAILEAAFEIIENGSSNQLTVDAVITRAGVSKGGFFHHFKSKEALLTTMVDWLLKAFEKDLPAETAAGNTSQEAFDAYIAHGFSGGGVRFRSGVVVLAIAAHHPELLEPIREYFRKRAAAVQASVTNPAAALAALLLSDGLWIMDALGIPPVSGEQRKEVQEVVRSWVLQST